MSKLIKSDTAFRAAEEVLIAFAADEAARLDIMQAIPTGFQLKPVGLSHIYDAMLALYLESAPVTATTVAERCGESANHATLVALETEPRLGAALTRNIQIVRRYARQARLALLLQETQKLYQDEGDTAALTYLQDQAAEIASDREEMRDNSGRAALARARANRQAQRATPFETRLEYLDLVIEGLAPGDKLVLAGPTKARKSTMARNLVLGLIAGGNPVSVFLYETAAEDFLDDLTAQIANAFLVRSHREKHATLSRRRLQAIHSYPTISVEWHDAIEHAEAVLDRMLAENVLFVYDRTDDIEDHRQVRNKIRRDQALYGIRAALIDDGTSLNFFDRRESYTDREHSRRAGIWMERVTQNKDVALVMLWQLNNSEQETDGHGVGLMGGIGVSAKADFVVQVRYPVDNDDNYMQVKMRTSRHTASGAATEYRVQLEPRGGMQLAYSYRKSGGAWSEPTAMHILPEAILLNGWRNPAGLAQTLPLGGDADIILPVD